MNAEDAALFDDVSHLGAALWARSLETSGVNSDPKMVSIMLFRRLWSHHRGYAVLFRSGLTLEADTSLRSSLEAAIYIAANFHKPNGLWEALKQDAVHTLDGQIKQFRDEGDTEMVKQAEAKGRWLRDQLPPGAKATRLEPKTMADIGKVPFLYHFYRGLSGTSSHVTGLSIMRGVVTEDGAALQDELADLTRKLHPLWQLAATLTGCLTHAILLDEQAHGATANALSVRLNERLAAHGFGD